MPAKGMVGLSFAGSIADMARSYGYHLSLHFEGITLTVLLPTLFRWTKKGYIRVNSRRRPGRDCRGPEAMDGVGLSHSCDLDSGNPYRKDGNY
ncbi:MAG: hypothetical protein Q7U98_02985 [Methylicorpusculum sp.]|uniref:hypothetical protein n=1 Tax=Methylicorpusculum sp. TaxID=2713644 RepID=UPI0027223CD7|nr:hypothetical protein [Methylicorpusculum sp.]MDO8938106.1 hypothetical protein [Methylicorpusculum sp.]MDO9240349.1 hypothetical protein [Methylicorpusculum sp.]MDP2202635.1 hypothetical protein [Methylicorpusculum sp.]